MSPAAWSNHPAHGYSTATGTWLALQPVRGLDRFRQRLARLLVQ